MSNPIIKKIEIQHPTTNVEVDIGAEAQSVTVSRNASGEIITDLDTETVDSTETLAETLKNEEAPFTGATASVNGTKGLVPQPLAGDENKCLFGDATWRESVSGSSITITSLEASLSGKQVSISDGTHTKTGTFDSSGICTITGITFVGNLTITSTDGTETATKIVNMPYFGVYSTTLSFWAATVNITGSDELKGALVTVKNSSDVTVGTVTLSLTDATGVFIASEADTYKFNYSYDGENYSEELEITSQITYNLSLSVGFDWKSWVDSSRTLHSTDYNSLSEVLADEEALRQLFLVHDCVDYMAEASDVDENLETILNNDLCAKWINLCDYALDNLYANTAIKAAMDTADKYGYGEWVITDSTTTPPTWGPKGNVPKMTSDTAPYGTAGASSESSTAANKAWAAFDGNPSTYPNKASNSSADARIYYKFTNPVNVKKALIGKNYASASTVVDYKVQYSDDGTNWSDATDWVSVTGTTGYINTDVQIQSAGYHLYWGVMHHMSGSWGSYANELQFYGRELKVSVPAMTSNTAPYGEASSSRNASASRYPWYAFKGVPITSSNLSTTSWLAGATGQYINYEFVAKMIPRMAVFATMRSSGSETMTVTIKGGNNEEYTDLGNTTVTVSTTRAVGIVSINTNVEYKKMRLQEDSNSDYAIGELQFYGLDYSEKEFEAGTTKKWLYDHGVELETISAVTSSDTTFVTKNADNVEVQTTTTGTNRIASAYAVVDTSPFSIARCKFGEVFNPTTNNIEFAVYSALPNYSQSSCSGYVYFGNGNSNLPYNCSLDISNVNLADGYISVAFRSSSTGYVRDAKLYELWLE